MSTVEQFQILSPEWGRTQQLRKSPISDLSGQGTNSPPLGLTMSCPSGYTTWLWVRCGNVTGEG